MKHLQSISALLFWLFMVLLAASPIWLMEPQNGFEPTVLREMKLAENYLTASDIKKASKSFRRAIDLTKHKADAYSAAISACGRIPGRRADICAADFARELITLNDSDKLDKELNKNEFIQLLMLHGQICYDLGLRDEAFQTMERAVKLSGYNPRICNHLGYLYADSNHNLNRSLYLIRIAVKAIPDEPMYVDSLGWVYYRLGRYKEAVLELRRAVLLSPVEPDLRYHLGAAYVKLGKYVEAVVELRKALAISPNHVDANKLYMHLRDHARQ